MGAQHRCPTWVVPTGAFGDSCKLPSSLHGCSCQMPSLHPFSALNLVLSYLRCDLDRSQSLLYSVPQSSWLDYCDLLLELLLLHLSLLCQQGSIMLWVLMLLFSCPCRVYNTFVTTYLVPTRSFGMWCQQGFWR